MEELTTKKEQEGGENRSDNLWSWKVKTERTYSEETDRRDLGEGNYRGCEQATPVCEAGAPSPD